MNEETGKTDGAEAGKMKRKAVILLSGGLDSATCLAIARSEGFELHALTFDYGQRHRVELLCARNIAKSLGVKKLYEIKFDLRQWGGSALTSDDLEVPAAEKDFEESGVIPVTYVPARNTIFLSFAASLAETLEARDIFIGVNSLDYSGYPDCRPAFIRAFEQCANLGTRAADEDWNFRIHAPLQNLRKTEIIRRGLELGVDYSMTHSCYNPSSEGTPCGICDSCRLRSNAFRELGMSDPAALRSRS